MTTASWAAIVFSVPVAIAMAFQLALAAGAPWGAYAMGGRFPGKLPDRFRVAAVVQAALLGLIAAAVLSRGGWVAGWIAPGWSAWGAVGVSAVALLLNAITPSAGERRIWVPVALVMLAASLTVALTA